MRWVNFILITLGDYENVYKNILLRMERLLWEMGRREGSFSSLTSFVKVA